MNASVAEVNEAWKLRVPIIEASSGSSNVEFGVMCAGEQHALLIFLFDQLKEIRFYKGTLTDRGVGIGSTLAELRRAYGPRLAGRGATFRVLSANDLPRTAIDFDLDEGRVVAISFGRASRNDWGDNLHGVAC